MAHTDEKPHCPGCRCREGSHFRLLDTVTLGTPSPELGELLACAVRQRKERLDAFSRMTPRQRQNFVDVWAKRLAEEAAALTD